MSPRATADDRDEFSGRALVAPCEPTGGTEWVFDLATRRVVRRNFDAANCGQRERTASALQR